MGFYKEHSEPKFCAKIKDKDCGKDTNITPSNPISGTMTQDKILTREQLAKME